MGSGSRCTASASASTPNGLSVSPGSTSWVGSISAGRATLLPAVPSSRGSNRVRAAIERAAEFIPEPHGSLYRGLVIGDDREQPPDMIDAVPGERVVAPDRSLRTERGVRAGCLCAAPACDCDRRSVGATVSLIAWFVVITRFEPSILRAGVMAGLSATAFMTGRERTPVRILALAVTGLLLVDPLLVWSVGFWLSVGATAGVCTVGPAPGRRSARSVRSHSRWESPSAPSWAWWSRACWCSAGCHSQRARQPPGRAGGWPGDALRAPRGAARRRRADAGSWSCSPLCWVPMGRHVPELGAATNRIAVGADRLGGSRARCAVAVLAGRFHGRDRTR